MYGRTIARREKPVAFSQPYIAVSYPCMGTRQSRAVPLPRNGWHACGIVWCPGKPVVISQPKIAVSYPCTGTRQSRAVPLPRNGWHACVIVWCPGKSVAIFPTPNAVSYPCTGTRQSRAPTTERMARLRNRLVPGKIRGHFPNPKRRIISMYGHAAKPCPYHGTDGTLAGSFGARENPWPFPNPISPFHTHVGARHSL